MTPAKWLPPAVIAATLGFLSYRIWGRTGEIMLDWGNELYTSWQISQGKVLFRDIAYFYGPLSPCFNSAIMRIFGPRMDVILAANFLILALVVALLYQLVRIMAGAFSALIAILFFLCVFALSVPTRLTNYNFLTPYAHPITHGFFLCLAVITCIDWFFRRASISAVIVGGLLTGLSFLTKPEIFLGCVPMYILGLAAAIRLRRFPRIKLSLFAAIAAILIPPVGTFLFFIAQMPFHLAIGGVLSGWQYLNKPYVVSTPFYKGSLGTDQIGTNFLLMIQYAALYAAGAIVLAFVGWIAGKILASDRWIIIVAASIIIASASFFLTIQAGIHFDSFWLDIARGLPVFAAFVVILTVWQISKSPLDPATARTLLLQWCLAVLAIAFLAKIILYARVYQYGFVLAAPAAILAVVALIHWLPAWVTRRGGSGIIVQMGAMGFLAAFALQYQQLTHQVIAERTVPIPLAFGGVAWTRPTESNAAAAIKYLMNCGQTVAVIPDAAGINYAAGLPNSVPYTELHPMGIAIYGQQNVVEAFNRHPPFYIVLMDFPSDAFGAHAFGRDYGLQLSQWIATHYRPIGHFASGQYPIELLQQKTQNPN